MVVRHNTAITRFFASGMETPNSNNTQVDQATEGEGKQIKNQDHAVDYKNTGFMDVGVSDDIPGSVRGHYVSTNNSGKGKR